MRLFENSDLRPLEIWHGQTSQGSLFEIQDEQLGSVLSEFLCQLHSGSARVLHKSDEGELVRAKNFETLFLTGGKAGSVFQSLSNYQLPFKIKLVENLGGLSDYDLTIDWGQTAIKYYTQNTKQTWPRDLDQFPIKCSTSVRADSTADCKLKVRKLFSNLIGSSSSQKIGLALPLKINHELHAEPSTYEGLEGNLEELFSGITDADIEVMNDAVLAARQIRKQSNFVSGKVLVLTIGYGVGAALWEK